MKMQELRCTAFGATPTYVLGMADTARKIGDLLCRTFGDQAG